ncbi:MAG: hypothetical protein WBE50_17675 [Methyloceanibacter sp.]
MIGTGNIIAVLDRENGGADSWLALVRKHHNVCTLHAHDGDGREYFLFANPNGMNAGTLARGLRVIDHTGISGFPDNLTIHGLPCSWWADCDAAKTPLVPAPDWLVRIPLSRTGRGNSRDPHQALDFHPKEDIAMATYSARRSAHPVPFRKISVIDVARVLLGEESRERSTATEKHFPDHAGLFVNVEKNRWYCHGDSAGGDGLGLVKFVEGCDVSAGIAWLQSHGFLDSTAPRSSASAEPHKKHGSETTRNAPSRLIATYA